MENLQSKKCKRQVLLLVVSAGQLADNSFIVNLYGRPVANAVMAEAGDGEKMVVNAFRLDSSDPDDVHLPTLGAADSSNIIILRLFGSCSCRVGLDAVQETSRYVAAMNIYQKTPNEILHYLFDIMKAIGELDSTPNQIKVEKEENNNNEYYSS